MSAIGRPVRFYADSDCDNPDRPEYDGFDGGTNMAGHDVWVTREVFLANMADDMRRHDGPADVWDEARRYAINNAVTTPNGILYPLVDCSLRYVEDHPFVPGDTPHRAHLCQTCKSVHEAV